MTGSVAANNTANNREKEPTEEGSTCKICWGADETEQLVKPCRCEGTSAFVHASCLQDWLRVNPSAAACVICKSRYTLPIFLRLKRLVRRYVGLVVDVCLATLGLLYILAMFARPLGFVLWFLFSVSTTDPFDSPMFLYMMKARETWNDIELDVDSALTSHHHIPISVYDNFSPVVDGLARRLASADSVDCVTWLRAAKTAIDTEAWLQARLEPFLNRTCGRHSDLNHIPTFRFCQCNVAQSVMTGQLVSALKRSLYRVTCERPLLMHRTKDGNDVYYARHAQSGSSVIDGIKVDSLSSFFSKFLATLDYVLFVRINPIRPLVRRLLPMSVNKYKFALTYVRYMPRYVNWWAELRNPRFYGFPFGIHDGGLSRGFVIKSLDYHFCITLICGIVIDLFLFIRLWYSGMSPLVESLQQALSSQSSNDNSSSAGTSGMGFGGFGGGWLIHLFTAIKVTLVEQWKTWVLLLVLQYQMLKAWWFVSQWSEIVADVCSIVFAFLCCVIIYVYLMVLVSIIVLRTFDMDVLHFQSSSSSYDTSVAF